MRWEFTDRVEVPHVQFRSAAEVGHMGWQDAVVHATSN